MRDLLRQKYENLFEKYNFEKPIEAGNINSIIKESLKEFLADKKSLQFIVMAVIQECSWQILCMN